MREFIGNINKPLNSICDIIGRIGFRGYTRNDIVEDLKGAISLSPANIINNRLSLYNCTYISWEKYNESPEIMVSKNDIVFCKTGSVGKTAIVKYVDYKMTINPQLAIFRPKEVNPSYLYYVIISDIFQKEVNKLKGTGSVSTISQKDLGSIIVPIPSRKVQEETVKILDSFTNLIDALNEELSLRQKQFEYYREKLLTFNDNSYSKTINEIGTLFRGNGLQKKDFVEEGIGCIHYGQIYTKLGFSLSKPLTFVTEDTARPLTKVRKGDLVIACTSENIEDVCKSVVWEGDDEIVTGGHACVFRHNENPRYIGYYFQTHQFFLQKKQYAYGAKVIDIKTEKLGEILIPIPSRREQNAIVSKLDAFESLISSLKEEIALRQKQYEYYREKLLTFE